MLCKAAEVVEALTWTNIAILQENNSGHFDKDFEVLCAEKRACARHTCTPTSRTVIDRSGK